MSKCAQSDLPGAYPIVSSKLSKMVVNFSSYPHLSPMSLLEWKPLHVDYIGGGFLQHYVQFFIFYFLFLIWPPATNNVKLSGWYFLEKKGMWTVPLRLPSCHRRGTHLPPHPPYPRKYHSYKHMHKNPKPKKPYSS